MNTTREYCTGSVWSAVALFSFLLIFLGGPAVAGEKSVSEFGINGGTAVTSGQVQYRLIYFDGHMHTTYSDGRGTVADIKQVALERGLSAVIVTDHSVSLTLEEWQALVAETEVLSDADLLMIPSVEVTGKEGSWHRDHVLGWGIKDPFIGNDAAQLKLEQAWPSPLNPEGTGPMYPEHLEKWIDYIHSQKGLAVQAHPLGTTQPEYGVDFIELYNLGIIKGWSRLLMELGFPEKEARENATVLSSFSIHGNRDLNMIVTLPGFPTPMPLRPAVYYATLYSAAGIGQWLGTPEAAPIYSWDELLLDYVNGVIDHPVFGVANTDAHNTANTVLNDPIDDDSDVGEVKNGVYVKGGSAKLSKKELFRALEAGRLFATTGPSLYFEVNGKLMGDTARLHDGPAEITIQAKAENPDAILVKVDIIKSGKLWTTMSPQATEFDTVLIDPEIKGDGYYRMEVVSWDGVTNEYRTAWANPVFFREEASDSDQGSDDGDDDDDDDGSYR